jgi:hypothetical protein
MNPEMKEEGRSPVKKKMYSSYLYSIGDEPWYER